jgi:hypothetical protein
VLIVPVFEPPERMLDSHVVLFDLGFLSLRIKFRMSGSSYSGYEDGASISV